MQVPLWASMIIAAICSVLSAAIVSMIQRRPAVMTASAAVQEQINAGFKTLSEQQQGREDKLELEVKALRRTVLRLIRHMDKLETALRAAGHDVPTMEPDEDDDFAPFDLILGGRK